MQLYAKSFNTNSSINEKIILKIKNTTTSVVTIVELTAEDNGSLIVTKSFRLPKVVLSGKLQQPERRIVNLIFMLIVEIICNLNIIIMIILID